MDKLSTTIEDYLSLIFVFERDGEPVVGVQLAELLNVTPPTVTNTLKRMARDKLIIMDKRGTRLTKSGWESARTILRRHMLTEWMMVKRLPWSKLHQEAHNLEHAISAETEQALLKELGGPQTCPHGNPLPGCEQAVASWIPLTQVKPNEKVVIRRIHELAEHDSELMAFLESRAIMPDQEAVVTEVLPFNQTITLQVQRQAITLGFASARYVFVEHVGRVPPA
ncbi:MAG TPA: metal-dependent transcriptional regulator [Anaerolineales bacterium]|nr:metal-dependent transcriptional regulator [Anaerolineales bacterium]